MMQGVVYCRTCKRYDKRQISEDTQPRCKCDSTDVVYLTPFADGSFYIIDYPFNSEMAFENTVEFRQKINIFGKLVEKAQEEVKRKKNDYIN